MSDPFPKLDVLAIGAHPDDIELACGGTVIKLIGQGKKVGLVDLTQGELGTRGSREIRAREAEAAAAVLGVTVRINLKMPDGNIEVTEENRGKLIQVIRRYRPDVLLMPHWFERHPDHEHAHRLAREAWFYAGLERIPTIDNGVQQEPHRPFKYFLFMQSYEFVPSFLVDISREFPRRMDAVRAFRSQFYDPDSQERETVLSAPEFFQALETRFAYFGRQAGVKYAEPFYSVEPVRVNDLFSLVP
jgi:N-acetylglucosamine malate deacetylase 1